MVRYLDVGDGCLFVDGGGRGMEQIRPRKEGRCLLYGKTKLSIPATRIYHKIRHAINSSNDKRMVHDS